MKNILIIIKIYTFLCVFNCLGSTPILAQNDSIHNFKKEVNALEKLCVKEKTTIHLDQYVINNPNIGKDSFQLQSILYIKARILMKISEDKIKQLPLSHRIDSEQMKEINALLDTAFPLCKRCQKHVLISKYNFYNKLNIKNQFPSDEFSILTSTDYKVMKTGAGVGLRYMNTPQTNWIGGDISIFQIFYKKYKFIRKSQNTKKQVRQNSSVGLLTLGYARSIEHAQNEFVFNGISLYSPITIKPLQFGRNWIDGGVVYGFYRPEIGYGHGPLYGSVGYNLYFNKNARDKNNQLVVTVGYSLPLLLFRRKVKIS